jgi:diguanylate cyclase (GGDEF)-like protein/PAS domain S-box-containing protein
MIEHSLKQRFLAILLPILLLAIGSVQYSQYLADTAASDSVRMLRKYEELASQIRHIKEGLQDLELLVYKYPMVSFSFEQGTQQEINNKLESLRQRTVALQAYLQSMPETGAGKTGLAVFANRLQAELSTITAAMPAYHEVIQHLDKRYPGMPIMENELLPAYQEFANAIDLAINDQESSPKTKETYALVNMLKDLRYVWSQQVSWFRLFVANRSGIFGTPDTSMKTNLNNRELYFQQAGEYLQKLDKLDQAGKLNLEVSSALEIMNAAYARYEKYFQQVKQVYMSKNWRADHAMLTNTIQPQIRIARNSIDELDKLQRDQTDNLLMQSHDVAWQVTWMIWLFPIVVLFILVVGYFIFEYLVRRPVIQVAQALNDEAAGKSVSEKIHASSTETQLLVDAFNNMREQVNSRQLRLESILDHAAEGIITYDNECKIESLNRAAERVFGYTEEEVAGNKLDILFAKYIPGVDTENLSLLLTCQGSAELSETEVEVAARNKDGSVFPLSVKTSNYEISGKTMFTAIVEDVSERKAMIENLRNMAEHDSLTGLYNRYYFVQELDHLVDRSERKSESSAAVLYLDLDNFKYVNDTLGHKAGDELLVQITCILQSRNRRSDLLARIGGDEFAMVLYDITEDFAVNVADIYRQNIHDYKFMYQGKVVDVGCSIGIIMVEPGSTREELLARADFSCHAAKLAGKNKIHLYSKEDQKDISGLSDDIGWTRRIKQALEDDMFVIACQPIKKSDGAIRHYEVLLRMLDEKGNLIMPSGFLPPAERFGLMPAIDRWVIRHTILLLKFAPDFAPELCVNLSAASFRDDSIIEFVTSHIKASEIDAQRLTFEVTETTAMFDLAMTARLLRKLQDLGCKTALDDFGAGYSSYAYLKNLPVNYVKIDGSFITGLENSSLNREIVKSMHNIAQIMGKQTIAEFVETAEAARILTEMGIDYLQGFYIGKPEITTLEPDIDFHIAE